ncbi:MAG: nucleotidyltransferase domain-containing protein, partial [Candidatus Korarchaeota archaeon]|nr:nucleotidyltransferase domain-containing protein [Candidatus Korarchaeota archaeon]
MNLKNRIMAKDPRLSIISSEVIQNIPCIEAVILCGSRAIIQGAKPLSMLSDYDVALVMKTPLIPFYLRRIKMVENKLSKKFGVKVNLNPLPTFRIRNAKGNLFLFKVKKEGITIWGKDYISMLDPGCIRDIGTDWYFSYLSSLMKEFVQN